MMAQTENSLLTELWKTDEMAEIFDDRLHPLPQRGEAEALTAAEILFSLHNHAKENGAGRAIPSNAIFLVDLPNRKSFTLDAAFINRPRSGARGAIEGAPIFAVEVRSENDYRPATEVAISQKRADYFAAGTLVVWDVDLLSEEIVRKYTVAEPDNPVIFRHGEVADAEAIEIQIHFSTKIMANLRTPNPTKITTKVRIKKFSQSRCVANDLF